jgi:predicted RND superfamily exporter protein
VTALVDRLTRLQTERPWRVLAVALASVVVAGLLASRLSLKTSFDELLPANKESVIVKDQLSERLLHNSTMTVVIEGSDNDGLKRFVDALAPEIEKIGLPYVGKVDEGVQQLQQFKKDYGFLYAPLEVVEEVHDEIIERYRYEVAVQVGTWIDDEQAPPPLTEERIRARLEQRLGKKQGGAKKPAKRQFPDGYYLDEERHIAVILVRTPISGGDLKRIEELKAKVRQVVAEVGPAAYDRAIEIGIGGNLITASETYAQIKGDLAHVGFWGVLLILSVVFLYYLRLRTLLAMALTVGIGAVWTFGLAYLLIGHLNSSTGFLFSIVVGNGINFGIIYMARYMEARRTEPVGASVRIAHLETWLATLAASGAATAAYCSLAVTDFRGFKHFGVIGGTGMLLCWLATYCFLPSILALAEKVLPIKPPKGIIARVRGVYGKPFAFVAGRYPRAVTVVALLVTAGAGVLSYRYVADDPMEYDMDNIDNDELEKVPASRRLDRIVDAIVGRDGQDGLAIATDRLDQVLPLEQKLIERRDAAPEGHKPFEDVVTIFDLLPKDQARKVELTREAYSYLERAHRKGFLEEKDWKKISERIDEDKIRVVGIEDLPEKMARPFSEADGTRGRLVYITPARGRSIWDGRYLIEWADSFRRTELPDGSVVKGSGRSVIYADMILAVVEDIPKALIASLVFTLLIVGFAFRARRAALWVIGAVLMGLVWTVAILAVYKSTWPWDDQGLKLVALKLNFLNFVALPITIGVGADYAVNVMHRYRLAGSQAMLRVMVETGGAVILCSLTTMLGYSALTLSVNAAIQSFGVAAAAGEICCVLSGVLVLPAALVWLARRRAARRPATTAS